MATDDLISAVASPIVIELEKVAAPVERTIDKGENRNVPLSAKAEMTRLDPALAPASAVVSPIAAVQRDVPFRLPTRRLCCPLASLANSTRGLANWKTP